MDLDLDMFRTRGRASRELSAVTIRELEPADFEMLDVEKGSTAAPLKRLSDRHHSLARHIAAGVGPGEAAIICGYDISRVSILQADPTFAELVLFYRDVKEREFRDVQGKLAGIASDALDELQTRIEDEPEKLSVTQLMALVTMGTDRTGNGPQSSTTNLNVNVGVASRLEEARKRVAERRTRFTVIDGTTSGDEA